MSKEISDLLASLIKVLKDKPDILTQIAALTSSSQDTPPDPSAERETRLLAQLADLKPDFAPLPRHAAADLDAHSGEAYARLLVAVTLVRHPLPSGTSTLLKMVLQSICGEGANAVFLDGSRLDAEGVAESIDCIRANSVEFPFLLDVLVLARLDGPLDLQQTKLIDEVADMLGLDATVLDLIINMASVVLGLPASQLPSSRQFDYGQVRVWDEFLWQPLAAQTTENEINGGRWDIVQPLSIQRPWSARDASFRFVGAGEIDTNSGGKVAFSCCNFLRARLTFQGDQELEFRNCNFSGTYPENSGVTAVSIQKISSVTFDQCQFTTIGARAIFSSMTPLNIERCIFENCGNKQLQGGAMAIIQNKCAQLLDKFSHRVNYQITIRNSSFTDCIASLGGAIRIDSLPNSCINDSKFTACHSFSLVADPQSYSGPSCLLGGAVFCTTTDSRYEGIMNSRFDHAGIFLGAIFPGDWYELVNLCEFVFSGVTKMPDDSNKPHCRHCGWKNETGDRDLQMCIPTPYEPWWNTY